MKKIIFPILTAVFIVLLRTEVKAQQPYKNAIGVHLGLQDGITFKTMISEKRALDFSLTGETEVIRPISFRSVSSEYSVFRLRGLYEIHANTNILPGLLWYYGAGASVGSKKHKPTDTRKFLATIDGVVGLDYKFQRAPINLSLDWKSDLELTPDMGFDIGGVNLAVRYTF